MSNVGQLLGIHEEDWRQDALCAQIGGDLWHPEKGGEREAKQVCRMCDVRQQCLAFALEHNELGIWGGTSWKERSRMKRGLPPAANRPVGPIISRLDDPSRNDPEAHGYARYKRGCRCEVCRRGSAEYQRLWQDRNRIVPRKRCQVCDAELRGRGRHLYCSAACKQRAYRGEARKQLGGDDA